MLETHFSIFFVQQFRIEVFFSVALLCSFVNKMAACEAAKIFFAVLTDLGLMCDM